jgi:hypothetical protein
MRASWCVCVYVFVCVCKGKNIVACVVLSTFWGHTVSLFVGEKHHMNKRQKTDTTQSMFQYQCVQRACVRASIRVWARTCACMLEMVLRDTVECAYQCASVSVCERECMWLHVTCLCNVHVCVAVCRVCVCVWCVCWTCLSSVRACVCMYVHYPCAIIFTSCACAPCACLLCLCHVSVPCLNCAYICISCACVMHVCVSCRVLNSCLHFHAENVLSHVWQCITVYAYIMLSCRGCRVLTLCLHMCIMYV